jgi:ferredoxin-like protein FixX
MSKQLSSRELAECDDGARTARVDGRALERRDARVAKQDAVMAAHHLRWARRDGKSKVHAYDARWRSLCGASVLTPEQQEGAVFDVSGAMKCARCELILNERGPGGPGKTLVMK